MKSLNKMMMACALVMIGLNPLDSEVIARGRVVIKVAPPAAKVVMARPACPYKNGVWVAGYWEWHHGRHVWRDGRWLKPKHGHVWVDGRWHNSADGWEWIPGHWKKL